MRNILLTLLLGVLCLFAMQTDAMMREAQVCARKNPAVVMAIRRFCSKNNIVVPSRYAGRGALFAGPRRTAVVKITGGCSPPQWVPQKYCYSQFYAMCARGDSDGRRNAQFGRNKCQTWSIWV
ncbi:hypothetical protein MBLNU230_g5547t1 [Neophaeotheca triangularis]